MTPDLQAIGTRFEVFGEFIQAVPCGNGHINDTFAAILGLLAIGAILYFPFRHFLKQIR